MAGERLEKALGRYRERYAASDRKGRTVVLEEFCEMTGYHRKYAITLLRPSGPSRAAGSGAGPGARRGPSYSEEAVSVLARIWEAAGWPWSVRLKALLPLWLPWARQQVRGVTPQVEAQLLRMSPRQMDRRLAGRKQVARRRIYGQTKPGTLLRQQIPVRVGRWDVTEPGWCEIDLVSHSGPRAAGEFLHSLNVTDIHSGWCETRAVMGKGERGVVLALADIRRSLPFELKGIDSDNGSEFINHHLARYCARHGIGFTRGRPGKKDDNAHIEQKNWTHVRRVFGWDRFETEGQRMVMNALYQGPLRTMMNLFQPSVRLVGKERVGSGLRRRYDAPMTPLDRLVASLPAGEPLPPALARLLEQRKATDPFELSRKINAQLERLQDRRRMAA